MSDAKSGSVAAGWCQISASADRASYRGSENVYVTVVLRNVSRGPVAYQPYPFAPGVDYEVSNENGSPTPLTAYGQVTRDSAGVSSSAVETLDAEKTVVYEILLNRQYDLTRPGRYQFRVSRKLKAADDMPLGTATSNSVLIEILADD